MTGQTSLFDQNKAYYNTTNLSGEELKEAEEKATTLDERIMVHFRKAVKSQTPFEVQKAVDPNGLTPITSFRRSITNLTEAGHLEKTNEQRQGEYGRPNYCWKLKTVNPI